MRKQVDKQWRRALRSLAFLTLGIVAFCITSTYLWIPFFLLAMFFFLVDIYGIDKRDISDEIPMHETVPTCGVLGDYLVDKTPSFGLFILLNKHRVFVDIRRDDLLELRKSRAKFLYEHQEQLTEQLTKFIANNPEFAGRIPEIIGLHSKDIEQAEVFWNPDGHTSLKGLVFSG